MGCLSPSLPRGGQSMQKMKNMFAKMLRKVSGPLTTVNDKLSIMIRVIFEEDFLCRDSLSSLSVSGVQMLDTQSQSGV
jgi:hypothetical protein